MAAAETLPGKKRVLVAQALLRRPELLVELRGLADQVPAAEPALDPFVGALRRCCWPNVPLRLLHRDALAHAPKKKLAFLALVGEEARTMAWHRFDPRPLEDFLDSLPSLRLHSEERFWLGERACEAIRFLVMLSTHFYSMTYDPSMLRQKAMNLNRQEQGWIKAKVVPDIPIKENELEGILGLALVSSSGRKNREWVDGMKEEIADRFGADEAVQFRLTLAWCHGFLRGDLEQAEWHLSNALAAVNEDCDPFIELLLRVQLAWAIVTRVKGDVHLLTETIVHRLPAFLDDTGFFEGWGKNPAAELMMARYEASAEEEWADVKPALDHLTAVSTLLAVYPDSEIKVRFHELRAALLVARDLPQAMEDMVEVVEMAKKRSSEDPRLSSWLTTAKIFKVGLERLQREDPRAKAALQRYVERLLPMEIKPYSLSL